jgi:hypothetical protein
LGVDGLAGSLANSTKGENMDNEIVGTWKNWVGPSYSFYDDGSYSYENPRTGHRTSGRYDVSGNQLTFITMGTSCQFSINGNKLVLYPPAGDAQEFERED